MDNKIGGLTRRDLILSVVTAGDGKLKLALTMMEKMTTAGDSVPMFPHGNGQHADC